MVKWIVAAVMVGIVVLLYCSIVSGTEAGKKEQAYWRDKARKEGREYGKEETPR